jgi:hypothetical protein
VGVGLPVPSVWPDPDGSLGVTADRQHMAHIYPGILSALYAFVEPHRYLRLNVARGMLEQSNMRYFSLVDGVLEPETVPGYAVMFVDAADGDLKVKFGDGFVAVIAADS